MNAGTGLDGWERGGTHHIVRGDFTISHAAVRGEHKYLLWQGGELRGMFRVAADAKRAADAIDSMEGQQCFVAQS